jgi:hypothetical protein
MHRVTKRLARAACTFTPKGVNVRRWLFLLVAANAPLTGDCADAMEAALQRPGAIVVADLNGEVTASFGQQKKNVKLDERLRVDTTLTTGRRSTVKLALSNGATVQVGSESEVEFEEFGQLAYPGTQKFAEMKEEPSISRTRLRLARGDVSAEVKPLKVSRGSSFNFSLVAGTLRISEGSFRAMVRMSDLGLGVCTIELLTGKAEFEVAGGKFEPLPAGRKLGFAIEIDKTTGNVKIGEMPKAGDVKSAPPAKGDAGKK